LAARELAAMGLPQSMSVAGAVCAAAPRSGFLSNLPATPRARRLALGVVLLSVLAFAAAAPFAKLKLAPLPPFLPGYQSALIIVEVLTAVLLFGQFIAVGSRALLLLAAAFLFSALMAAAHLASFPGLFSPSGLLGAGPQTTAWLYFLWHSVFPLLVVGYALLTRREDAALPLGRSPLVVLAAVAAAFALAGALTLLATAGHAAMPVIMQGDTDAPAKTLVAWASWILCLASLAVLWWRRAPTLLDLWLMVVMVVWIFDIALAAVLNGGRFDLGWYAGRVYGLAAACFVLFVLLLENGVLYSRLAQAKAAELEQAQRSLARHAERLRLLREIDRAVLAEQTPDAIAAAVIQPLRELLGVPRAIVNRFDLEAGEVEWVAAAGRRRTHVGPGVRYSTRLMGDLAALRRGEPQRIDVKALPPGRDSEALLASDVRVYMVVPMIAGGELIGAISFGGAAADFPPEHIAIAQEVAAQLAIATTQARLLEQVKGDAADLEARVRERTAELEAANRELDSFSYSVSHDLRAPLRAVDGYAQMLEEDYGTKLDDEGRRLIRVVRESGRRMAQLIEDLLALSRLGRQAVTKAPLDMAQLAHEALEELEVGAGVSVSVAALPQAHADRSLMKLVWTNLISNAVKYSGKRQDPRIEIGAREEPARSVYWVCDNGAGFDMRYADKLFGVFQRLHRQDEFPGTGVGLAIVQRIVRRHGGDAWAEGRPGEGARFFFTLPAGA
jgi:signal transduction histidine kinase